MHAGRNWTLPPAIPEDEDRLTVDRDPKKGEWKPADTYLFLLGLGLLVGFVTAGFLEGMHPDVTTAGSQPRRLLSEHGQFMSGPALRFPIAAARPLFGHRQVTDSYEPVGGRRLMLQNSEHHLQPPEILPAMPSRRCIQLQVHLRA